VGGVGGAKAESRERRRLGKEDRHGVTGSEEEEDYAAGRSPIVRTLRLSPTMTPKPILGYGGGAL
jgi:hypothetical protein